MMKPQKSLQKQRKTVSYQKHEVNKDSQLQRKQINKTRRINSAKTITPQHPGQSVKTSRTMNPSMPQLPQHSTSSLPKLTAIPILANPQQTYQLDYSFNKIVLIPQNMSSIYVNLVVLHLSHNQITNIQSLCGLVQMKELYLDNNLVNNVPKEIKNLTKLQVLDLSYNKLWYVSQVAALNDLVTKRVDEIGEYLDLRLEGNSVVKTNEKALKKLLHVANNVKVQTCSKFTTTSAAQLQQNKQNISPNISKSPAVTKKTSNHNKSGSLSKTLLDMSSIIANFPTTETSTSIAPLSSIQQAKQKKQSINLLEKKLNMKEKSISLFMEQLKLQKNQSPPSSANHPLLAITSYDDQFSPMSRSAKNLSYQQLFKQVSGFESLIIEPAMKQLTQVSDLERKLTLIHEIKTVPEVLKPQFCSMNAKVIQTAIYLKQLLQPFTSFYSQDHTQFSQKIQQYLNAQNGPHPQIHSFHQRTLNYYLNSSQTKQIKWYQVWMKQYDLFQKKLLSSEKLLKSYIQIWKKVHKLSRVGTLLCEAKNTKNAGQSQKQCCLNIYTQKKSSSRKQLNNLLFSQLHDKQNSLFSSGKKQSLLLSHRTTKSPLKSSPQPYRLKSKPNCEDCLQCPIKEQQVILLQQKLKKEHQKTLELERNVKLLQQKIESLNQFKKFSDQIAIKQIEIISQIEVIKPSTYQNVLLTQALCIQDFIREQQLYPDQEKMNGKNSPLNFNSYQATNNGENNISETAIQTKKNKNKQSIYVRGQKIQLNQFLLTEDSSKSNKNTYRQGTQRTYFKTNGTGNGTMPFSHSARSKIYSSATNNQQQRNSISSKGRPFEVETKLYTISRQQNSRNITSINQVLRISGHQNNSTLMCKNDGKNGVFEKIVVGQFRNQKEVYNIDRYYITNENIVNEIKSEKCEMTQFQKKRQTYPILNLNQKNKNLDIDFSIGNHPKKSSFQNINPSKNTSNPNHPHLNSKTIPGQQAFCMKQLYSYGYKYDDINFDQNQQYKNYIKNHLRNNIKQLLDKKYIEQEEDYGQIISRMIKKDSKPQIEKNRTNKFINTLTGIKCDRKIQSGEMKFLSQTKNKCHGKYIRKRLDTDVK